MKTTEIFFFGNDYNGSFVLESVLKWWLRASFFLFSFATCRSYLHYSFVATWFMYCYLFSARSCGSSLPAMQNGYWISNNTSGNCYYYTCSYTFCCSAGYIPNVTDTISTSCDSKGKWTTPAANCEGSGLIIIIISFLFCFYKAYCFCHRRVVLSDCCCF